MTLPRLFQRLIARLAFLATLSFALGLFPRSVLVSFASETTQGAIDDDEEERWGEEAALREREESGSRAARPCRLPRGSAVFPPLAQRAAPLAPISRIRPSPPRVLKKPFIRLHC